MRPEQFLRQDGFHVGRDGAPQSTMHFFREQVENTPDRGRGAGGVNRAEHQVARFRSMDGRHERLFITHFADEHDIGVFAHRVFHADFEILDIDADLALVDQALLFVEHELDRVLQGENVLAVQPVDVVQHRGNGRTLAGPGDACQQHHSLVKVAQLFDRGRQMEARKIGNEVVDAAGNETDLAHLLQHVHAEPPAFPVDIDHIREVATAVLVKDLPRSVVHHRKQQPDHFLRIDGSPIERPQLASNPHHRRAENLHVQIAAFELDERAEILVDLQLLVFARIPHNIDGGGFLEFAKRVVDLVRRSHLIQPPKMIMFGCQRVSDSPPLTTGPECPAAPRCLLFREWCTHQNGRCWPPTPRRLCRW